MSTLSGCRIMIVEDEGLIALLLEDKLTAAGAVVVGPYPTLAAAEAALDPMPSLDGALLDIQLRGEQVFPVAERLQHAGVPFVFLTGYGERVLPGNLARCPVVQKPFQDEDLIATLAATMAGARTGLKPSSP